MALERALERELKHILFTKNGRIRNYSEKKVILTQSAGTMTNEADYLKPVLKEMGVDSCNSCIVPKVETTSVGASVDAAVSSSTSTDDLLSDDEDVSVNKLDASTRYSEKLIKSEPAEDYSLTEEKILNEFKKVYT